MDACIYMNYKVCVERKSDPGSNFVFKIGIHTHTHTYIHKEREPACK